MKNEQVAQFFQSFTTADSFNDGAKKIAARFRATEERIDPAEVVSALLTESVDPKLQEYLLYCFLDISRADLATLTCAAPLRQLRRLVAKSYYHPEVLSDTEQELLQEINRVHRLATIDDVVATARLVTTVVQAFVVGEGITPQQRKLSALLLQSEATALKERTEWLSDHVDAYNMMAIARLLPLLTMCDEQIHTLKEICSRIAASKPLGAPTVTFAYHMQKDTYKKWLGKICKQPELKPFFDLLMLQEHKKIPIRKLVAVATLSRHLHAPTAPPLTWMSHALNSSTSDGFRIDAGSAIKRIEPLLALCSVTPQGTVITGNFAENSYLSWIGCDLLTRVLETEVEPSIREILAQCLKNDALLIRLLDNPRIAQAPGMVQQIATITRSIPVLHKIALTRELHSGQANSGVPYALLRNPAHIPLTELRSFINTRSVSLAEMRDLLRNPYGIRREVYEEIKSFTERHR